MPVSIEQISVQNLGPIADLTLELGPFNLIYGHNELGKTYLVEFVLKSLFKSAAKWPLRSLSASGRVLVAGLAEEPVSFSPSSPHKLESYWEDAREGLPPDVARLLVVKGAELSMVEDAPGGINRATLKHYLSSEGVLDDIRSRISKTLQGASVEDGEIEGYQMGEIKSRLQVTETLSGVDTLFEEIDGLYSGGRRKRLAKKLEELSSSIKAQEDAKHHQAYVLAEEIAELEAEQNRLSQEAVQSLTQNFRDYQRASNELATKERAQAELRQARADFLWLDSAIDAYQQRGAAAEARQSRGTLFAAFFALVLSIVFALFGLRVWAALAIVLGLFAGWLYVRNLRGLVKKAAGLVELRRIEKDFESRFGRKLSSLPVLQALKEELQERYYRCKTLQDDIDELRSKLDSLAVDVRSQLRRLSGRDRPEAKWGQAVRGLGTARRELQDQLAQKNVKLAGLNVEAAEYLEEDSGVTYQKSRLRELESEAERAESDLQEETIALQSLKQRICDSTGDDISIEWQDLVQNLKARRAELAADYKRATAEVVAKILVNEELERIREKEDEKIRDTLRSKLVTEPLAQVTGHYQSVDLKGDQLLVSDLYDDFYLSDLSTGAQEQVLLALRVGFASKIMGRERSFLILDDAFQYADWERRGWLLEEAVALAKEGWQIIYLTMDDHIRHLFQERGAAEFGDAFHYAALVAAA